MTVLIGKKLNKVNDGGRVAYQWWCPACDGAHMVHVDGTQRHDNDPPNWEWNGDGDRPSFHPSVNVSPYNAATRCHSWVKDGKMTYCADSWHEFKNQTLDIPDWDGV